MEGLKLWPPQENDKKWICISRRRCAFERERGTDNKE
jgi:hypothetical protein